MLISLRYPSRMDYQTHVGNFNTRSTVNINNTGLLRVSSTTGYQELHLDGLTPQDIHDIQQELTNLQFKLQQQRHTGES